LRTANNGQIAEYVGMIGFYQLPLDYLDTFTSKVNAVSPEQIADAFKRRLQPDKMVTVIVGGEDAATKDSKANVQAQPSTQGQ
jgi:zinc protease